MLTSPSSLPPHKQTHAFPPLHSCPDIASALAVQCKQLDDDTCLAAHAAAGQWSLVLPSLRQQLQRSLYPPAPPPRGSQLHGKCLAAAAGCLAHGQLSLALELLGMAGTARAVAGGHGWWGSGCSWTWL